MLIVGKTIGSFVYGVYVVFQLPNKYRFAGTVTFDEGNKITGAQCTYALSTAVLS